MIPYNEFPGFEHIYPEDSFVLSCDETDAEIVFSIDLVLTSTITKVCQSPCPATILVVAATAVITVAQTSGRQPTNP